MIAPVELIVILYKDQWKKTNGTKKSDITKDEFMEWTNGLWTFNGESKKKIGHPAPFPRELPYRCIKLFSYVDDLVFDPFCGSGTTLIEAYLNQRKAISLEIDSQYRDIQHQEAVDWLTSEYTKRTGKIFRDPERAIRKLHQKGYLIKISK